MPVLRLKTVWKYAWLENESAPAIFPNGISV